MRESLHTGLIQYDTEPFHRGFIQYDTQPLHRGFIQYDTQPLPRGMIQHDTQTLPPPHYITVCTYCSIQTEYHTNVTSTLLSAASQLRPQCTQATSCSGRSKVKKVNLSLEQTTNTQWGSRGMALIFLYPRR